MKWVTWQNVGIDRIGCAWLIRKFIDKNPEFIFIPEGYLIITHRIFHMCVRPVKCQCHGSFSGAPTLNLAIDVELFSTLCLRRWPLLIPPHRSNPAHLLAKACAQASEPATFCCRDNNMTPQ